MRAIAAISLLLAGCATAPSGPEPQDITNAIGNRFAGGPIGQMVARYGAPYQERVIAGETIYSWERTEYLDFGRGPLPYRCQLDAYTKNGIVSTVGLSGKLGGCDTFIP